MPALSGLEQSLLAARLGPAAVFNPKRATGHWVLDAATPGGMEVGRRLVAAAVASGDLPNIWNLRLRGACLGFLFVREAGATRNEGGRERTGRPAPPCAAPGPTPPVVRRNMLQPPANLGRANLVPS
jgi:hypothetical protein